jgi:hypothetical protein
VRWDACSVLAALLELAAAAAAVLRAVSYILSGLGGVRCLAAAAAATQGAARPGVPAAMHTLQPPPLPLHHVAHAAVLRI